jgi:hypothetical protein
MVLVYLSKAMHWDIGPQYGFERVGKTLRSEDY